PTAAAIYAVRAGPTAPNFDVPFPNEPELVRYFGKAIGLHVGGEFRGSVAFVVPLDLATMLNFWIQGIPTINEYSQLVTPEALYLKAALFKHDIVLGELNHFVPWIGASSYDYDVLLKTLQALGVRYTVHNNRHPAADERHFPFVTFPRRPV